MEEAQKNAAASQNAATALEERLKALESAQRAQNAQNKANAAPMVVMNAQKEEKPREKTAADFYKEAQNFLAKRDYKSAVALFKKAADMGDQNALYALAEAYEKGQGVEADEDKALELYRQVKFSKAQADVTRIMNSRFSRRDATYKNAVRLHHAKDEVGALKEFENSAKFGDLCGAYETAHRYMRGVGTKADVKKAIEYYEQVIADKDAATKRASSQTYYTDYAANIKTESLFALGKAYCFEEAVKDVERGVVCLLQAADGNHKEALWLLAKEYERGEIVSPDKKKAVDYVTRAAKAACVPARYDLARRYEEGDGMEKSLVKSIEIYDSMADLWRTYHYEEYKAAQENVDRILEKYASRADEDYEQAKAFASRHEQDKAYPLFEEAAWLGHVGGMVEFASICESETARFNRAKKTEDATKSYYKAQDWYKKAAEKGHLKATLWVAKDEEKNHHDLFAAASYKKAIAALEQAQKSSESVDREIVFEIADVYLRGVGDHIKASADKAIAVLTPLSNEGDAEAKWKVAEIYYDLFKKNNFEPNKKKALELYEELAADSNAGERGDQARKFLQSLKEAAAKSDSRNEVYFEAANIYFDRGEYEKAVPMYELLAEKGHLGGTYRYAVCLLKGWGVKMDASLARWEASRMFSKAVDPLKKLAESGDETALWLMGEAYASGYIVLKSKSDIAFEEWLNDSAAKYDYNGYDDTEEKKKESKALGYGYWEKLAAVKKTDKDEPTDLASRAIYELAYHYLHDKDISRQTAYDWNWRAMYTDGSQRDEAMISVAGFYAHNTEVEKQVTGKKLGLKIAVQLYQIAAELGNSLAEQSLKALKKEKGLALVFAGGPKLNLPQLVVDEWKTNKQFLKEHEAYILERASRSFTEEKEEIRLRKEEEKRKELERVQQELDRLQKQGWDAKRFFDYAKGVTNGKWFVDDEKLEKVFYYLERAAKLGNVEAAYVTGCGYLDGRVVDKNESVAASWFQKAAAQGNADAASNLGDMYKSGKGVKKDLSTARQYYTKAAQSNSVPAQTHAMIELGLMCRDGKGGAKDAYSAKYWIEKAASYGATKAQNLLKKMK